MKRLREAQNIGQEYGDVKGQLGGLIQSVNAILDRYQVQHDRITKELEGRLQGMGSDYASGRKAMVRSKLQTKQVGQLDQVIKGLMEDKKHLITRYEKRIQKVEETVGEMQGKLDELGRKGTTDMEAVAELTRKAQTLQSDLEGAKRELVEKRDLLGQKEQEIMELRRQLADTESDRDQFGELLMIYEKRTQEYEKIVANLEKKHDDLRAKYMEMRDMYKSVIRYTRDEPAAQAPAMAGAGATESNEEAIKMVRNYGSFNLTEHLQRGHAIEQRLKLRGR